MNEVVRREEQKKDILTLVACPACKSLEIKPFMKYDSFPAILFPVEENEGGRVREALIESLYCKDCRHIFLNRISRIFLESIYKDYYQFYPYKNLESMLQPYRLPFDKVADIFLTKADATLLEIGCDNVAQMEPFIKRGYRCTAINPGAEAAASRAVHFIDGYYGERDVEGCFDYIISRFNLEHAVDLDAFFDSIDKNISQRGVVIVQVPNAALFIESGMLNIMAHEHPHNFCQSSLCAVLKRRGYQVLHLSQESSPSLICVFTKCTSIYDPHLAIKQCVETIEKIRLLLVRNQGRQVLFYGAGLSLAAILYSKRIDDSLFSMAQIVDDNPLLAGRIMPNTRLRVQLSDEVRFSSFAIIILSLNEIYHEKVLARIRAAGAFGEIYAIGKKGISLLV
jgi:uncharacterized protein YbaR (Trm112 family)